MKAHVGEWGTAQDIVTAVKGLHLNEIQHGIAAVQDEDVISFLAENDSERGDETHQTALNPSGEMEGSGRANEPH